MRPGSLCLPHEFWAGALADGVLAATAVLSGIGMATICALLPSQVTWPFSSPGSEPMRLARFTTLVAPVRRSRMASLVKSRPVA